MDWFDEIVETTLQAVPMLLDDEEESIFPILTGETVHRRASRSARRPNIDRDFASGHLKLYNDYFADNPTYSSDTFIRRFRIPKFLFVQISDRLQQHDEFFRLRCDAAGKIGLSTLQKCTAAMRMLAYGVSANSIDENVRIGETTTLVTLKKFCSNIVKLYGPEYLRGPSKEDRLQLMEENGRRGFPGMIASIDCMHWSWKNCPVALKGQFQGKEGKPTVVLEAVASKDLYIWHSFFGCPGSCNDLNVLDRSPLLNDVLQNDLLEGEWSVGHNAYSMGYFLADNIYPDWPIFLKSIKQPQTAKEKYFAKCQESVRKDVERAFGVLQACWQILVQPCRLWFEDNMKEIILTCIILHNMRVRFRVSNEEYELLNCSTAENASFERISSRSFEEICIERANIRNPNRYFELRTSIMDHLWSLKGERADF